MPIDYSTVAIPVVKGIDVNTRARLVPAQYLLEAINSRFSRGTGAEKRRGHTTRRVRSSTVLPQGVELPLYDTRPTSVENYDPSDRSLPESWLFGWGSIVNTELRASPSPAYETSTHPDACLLFGSTTRDAESLLWNGYQLFSNTPEQQPGAPLGSVGPAVLPVLKAEPIAKSSGPQTFPDTADNRTIRVVTWMGASNNGYYTVLDSTSGATLLAPTAISGVQNYIRAIPVGEWLHLVYQLGVGGNLTVTSIHQSSPTTSSTRSLGVCNGYYDTHKVSESTWVVARNDGSLGIQVSWLDADGSPHTTLVNSTPAIGTVTDVNAVAIAVHPTSGNFALSFVADQGAGPRALARLYTAAGASDSSLLTLGTLTATDRAMALAPKYILDDSDGEAFDPEGDEVYEAYFDDVSSSTSILTCVRFASTILRTTTRYHMRVASQAFRVGDRTYCWVGHGSTLQSSWLLLDEGLAPVGHLDYVTANVPASSAFPALSAMNWSGTAPVKDTCVFHGVLGYRVRVPSEATAIGTNVPAVYTEPSIRSLRMDFLPRLRSAQAGRCTYFAGAQLWSYDGSEIVESAFHLAPEGVTTSAGSSGGGLTTDGSYTYRVDLCYRNAQNEEVRSQSFYTTPQTVTAGQKITLTIPIVPTRRSNSYFLIFRNAHTGTQWFLCNSRDPASALFVLNTQGTATATLLDDGISTPTDATLISREQHPGNGGFNYIDQVSAPACELVSCGRDRLWVAGGEVAAGQVAPSRLFTPTETPSFNPIVCVQVDRSAEPFTAIGFMGESAVLFRRNHAYIQNGEGPDNAFNGVWDSSRLAFSDVGAVGQESLALISSGLFFQSPAGIRLIAPGGGLQPVGAPMDSVAKTLDIAAAVVVGEDQEVRFYARSGDTLVYNYQYDCWSTWTVTAVGACRAASGLAQLASWDGFLWEETDDHWLDNGATYRHRIRFAWLRAGSLMDFQRVRRIGAIGEWEGTEHSVHVEVFYDERGFYEETFDWDVPEDADDASWNTDTFGAATFGDGTLGDTDAGS